MNDKNVNNTTTSNVMIVVTLPLEMYTTVKKICDEASIDISDFLRRSIEKHIKEAKNNRQ